MQLFYNGNLGPEDTEIRFSKEESRHIVKVLRRSVGDHLFITNGKGILFTAEIISADIKNCIASIRSHETKTSRPYRLHMAVAPTKSNDRFEWFLEKATEIGIDEITPIICENSERRVIKQERLEKIVQAAMKQSLSCYLPKLNPAIPFKSFLDHSFKGQTFIAHCEDSPKTSLKSEVTPGTELTLLIGPEGDFSIKEIELAIERTFKPISLGDTRLRTETAAIVACHTVALMNEV